MRKILNPLTTEGKNSKEINTRRTKSFGYQILGFGSGGAGAPDFVTATGGTITCSGDWKIHTFTGPGTFTVTAAGVPCGSTTVDYMVVAGGGGTHAGGSGSSGGGGGGGEEEAPSVAVGSPPVPPPVADGVAGVNVVPPTIPPEPVAGVIVGAAGDDDA